MIMWFLWPFVCTGPVSRHLNESKLEREGRAEDTHLGVISKQETNEIVPKEHEKDRFFSFGHKNADVASHLKYFTSDGLSLLGKKKKVYLLRVEPKY